MDQYSRYVGTKLTLKALARHAAPGEPLSIRDVTRGWRTAWRQGIAGRAQHRNDSISRRSYCGLSCQEDGALVDRPEVIHN